LNFPADFLKPSGTFRNPGMVVNVEDTADNPAASRAKKDTDLGGLPAATSAACAATP
jgi:hypothetical protein